MLLPQSYVDFENIEEPIQTHIDTSSMVVDLKLSPVQHIDIHLQSLAAYDYAIFTNQFDFAYFTDYYRISEKKAYLEVI